MATGGCSTRWHCRCIPREDFGDDREAAYRHHCLQQGLRSDLILNPDLKIMVAHAVERAVERALEKIKEKDDAE